MGERNELDQALSRLPSESPSQDLTDRVCKYVWRKRRQKMCIHYGISFLLALGGLWLSRPVLLTSLYSTDLSKPALSLLVDWIQVALAGIESSIGYAWGSITGVQSNLTAPIDISVGLGIMALALSILIALGQLFPQYTDSMRKGVNA